MYDEQLHEEQKVLKIDNIEQRLANLGDGKALEDLLTE